MSRGYLNGINSLMKVLPDFKLFIFLSLTSVFIFLFDQLGMLNFPKSLLQSLTIPIQYGFYKSGTSLSRQFEFVAMVRRASLENKALKRQLGDLLVENANLRKKLAENESLLEQYSKLNPKTYDLLPSRPIGTGRFVTLDRGLEDGVGVGQTVVFKDSLIGQIKQVSPKTSEVMLLSDPDSKIAVYSQNSQGKAKGILQGQFGSEILMDKILHQETVEAGDLVYSEGTEGKFPKGLIVGKVTEVFQRENEVFKQAKVEPIYDIHELDMLFVIRNI